MVKKYLLIGSVVSLINFSSHGEDVLNNLGELELYDKEDQDVLIKEDMAKSVEQAKRIELSELEELDDLQSIQSEIEEDIDVDAVDEVKEFDVEKELTREEKVELFEVGEEEQKLLELANFVKGKITDDEWNSIYSKSKPIKYVVKEGDYLWKISQRLFGSGFYYAKIWSLNSQITNPHEIEPGMVLVFETGDENLLPTVKFGEFKDYGNYEKTKEVLKVDLAEFGDDTVPNWLEERKRLQAKGAFFQFLSDEGYKDFDEVAKRRLNKEYQKYIPPLSNLNVIEDLGNYDEVGFDKYSKISFDYKEGYFLNTFVATNIVQDFGRIEAIEDENVMIHLHNKVYVNFEKSVHVKPGDQFSVYQPKGKVGHKISDREGYEYTIVAQIKAIKKINNLWECEVIELTGVTRRLDRVTVYTQKIDKIIRTFNERNIEAAIVHAYRDAAKIVSYGDVVYLDRGRADGVEIGNVFEVYSFFDRGTEKKITRDPTYKIGEITIISLTDDFATGLVTNSSNEIMVGNISFSKSAEDAARMARIKNKTALREIVALEKSGLENLDVEIDLTDLSDDLLKKAEKVQLTEDEIEELERQELEKSVLSEHEKDLQDLERLEKEIVNAENRLHESKVDEDKFLEDKNLDVLEKENSKVKDVNEFAGLDEIEQEVGRQYIDEDLNAKENPYGLSEFDLEELDELMNTESE